MAPMPFLPLPMPPAVIWEQPAEERKQEMTQRNYSPEQFKFLDYIKHRYDPEFAAQLYRNHSSLRKLLISYSVIKNAEHAVSLQGKNFTAISKHDAMFDYVETKMALHDLGLGDSPTPLAVAARDNTHSDGLREIILKPLHLERRIFPNSHHPIMEGTKTLFEKMGSYKIPFNQMTPAQATVFTDYVMDSCQSGENHLVYTGGGRQDNGELPSLDEMSTGLVKILSLSIRSLGNDLFKLGSRMQSLTLKPSDPVLLGQLSSVLKKRSQNVKDRSQETRAISEHMQHLAYRLQNENIEYFPINQEEIRRLGHDMMHHPIDMWILPICINYANRPEEKFFPFIRWAKQKKKHLEKKLAEQPALPQNSPEGITKKALYHVRKSASYLQQQRRQVMKKVYHASYIGADAGAYLWRYYRSKAGFPPNSVVVLSFGEPFNILEHKDHETGRNNYRTSQEIMRKAYTEIQTNHKKYSNALRDWNFTGSPESVYYEDFLN